MTIENPSEPTGPIMATGSQGVGIYLSDHADTIKEDATKLEAELVKVRPAIGRYAKGILAAVVGGLTALQTANLDGQISTSEWITVAIATVVGGGLVTIVPNASKSEGQ